ncbi:unnamed protein product, partial [Vitis vinifera]
MLLMTTTMATRAMNLRCFSSRSSGRRTRRRGLIENPVLLKLLEPLMNDMNTGLKTSKSYGIKCKWW